MDIHHLALWVSDIDRTRTFYVDTIGLEVVRGRTDGETEHLFVRGDTDHQIQFKHEPERDVDIDRSQIDHLAILVDDLDGTMERLRGGDSEIIQDIQTIEEGVFGTQRTAFVTDPDGYACALIEPVSDDKRPDR